jgi:hypothetical protein
MEIKTPVFGDDDFSQSVRNSATGVLGTHAVTSEAIFPQHLGNRPTCNTNSVPGRCVPGLYYGIFPKYPILAAGSLFFA